MKRYKVNIKDKYEKNGAFFLKFDLKEILDCISDQAFKYSWVLYNYEFVSVVRPNERILDLVNQVHSETSIEIKWNELLIFPEVFLQTENMLLVGGSTDSFIKIEAIDTSFWEIETDNAIVIENVNKKFKNIELS